MCEHDAKANCFEYIDSQMPRVPLDLVVNGERVHEMIDPAMTLLDFLRVTLKLFGTKEGCREGECGACTLIMNGRPVTSCLILAVEAQGAEILTVEGLSKDGELSILQEEFIREDGLQCGFCTPGMLIRRKLLDRNPNPTADEVKSNSREPLPLHRYKSIIDAILSADKQGNG